MRNYLASATIITGIAALLKADLFNVFNRQVAEVIEERYNTGTGLRNTYGAVLSYSNPRSVKFTVAYDHKF